MAPFVGPTRTALLALLSTPDAERRLPVTLGMGAPAALVRVRDGAWEVVRLELDAAHADALYRDAQARGSGWEPGMDWAALRPGEVLLSASDAPGLATLLRDAAPPGVFPDGPQQPRPARPR